MQGSFCSTVQGEGDRAKSDPREQMELLQYRWQGEWWESSGPKEYNEKDSMAKIEP